MATATKERPIIFNGEMVRAIMRGDKTQTRRVIKNPERLDGTMLPGEEAEWCPYGKPGDRLWVRETWGVFDRDGSLYDPEYPMSYGIGYSDPVDEVFWIDAPAGFREYEADEKMRPSIHMPRWASRILLEVVDIRVERVQDITYEGCRAEGVAVPIKKLVPDPYGIGTQYFEELWNSINTKRGYGWDMNPWVWVVEFKKLETSHGD